MKKSFTTGSAGFGWFSGEVKCERANLQDYASPPTSTTNHICWSTILCLCEAQNKPEVFCWCCCSLEQTIFFLWPSSIICIVQQASSTTHNCCICCVRLTETSSTSSTWWSSGYYSTQITEWCIQWSWFITSSSPIASSQSSLDTCFWWQVCYSDTPCHYEEKWPSSNLWHNSQWSLCWWS